VPVYDYLCSNCREITEVIHGIDAPGPRFCPACGAEGTLRKAFAPPTVHFKGSGWAKKDRSTASTKARAKADAGAETGAGKEGTSSGDSPPSTDKSSTDKSSTESSSSAADRSTSGGSSRSASSDAPQSSRSASSDAPQS
jgi:putative FmdB family regulatory protein